VDVSIISTDAVGVVVADPDGVADGGGDELEQRSSAADPDGVADGGGDELEQRSSAAGGGGGGTDASEDCIAIKRILV
jgi:hypothetical protein